MIEKFSWIQKLVEVRQCIAKDMDEGLCVLSQNLRAHPPLKGFEIELVGRLLQEIDVAKVVEIPVHRVAVLSNYTTQPIAHAVRVALLTEGYFAEIYEAPFGVYQQEILSEKSGLYLFSPDVVVIAVSFNYLQATSVFDEDSARDFLSRHIQHWKHLWDVMLSRLNKPILQHLYEMPSEEFLGIAERRSIWTISRLIHALNETLLNEAPSSIKWLDVDNLAARVGRQNWFDARLYYHGKIGFNPRFLPEYALIFASVWRSAVGKSKKALILDLDNTLWGGVIGDDGLEGIRLGVGTSEGEAYQVFACYVKELGQRGVILGICSKNELVIASEVFETHPHMPLKLSDFAVISCNWENKASNLTRIAQELNIDISSLVFIDDNPAECELIRQAMPEVTVIQLENDPAQFVRVLDNQHLFDSQFFSKEDFQRAESYRARAKLAALQVQAPDLDTYLSSLEMKAQIEIASEADLPRLAQMEMKTNQFNLSTRRLSLEQLQAMSASPDVLLLTISLADRFAEHGLVSYVACDIRKDKLVITDWLMSCRVFSRTLEHLIFNQLTVYAEENGVQMIVANFKLTAKNKIMEAVFLTLGFSYIGDEGKNGAWQCNLASQNLLKSFISLDAHI